MKVAKKYIWQMPVAVVIWHGMNITQKDLAVMARCVMDHPCKALMIGGMVQYQYICYQRAFQHPFMQRAALCIQSGDHAITSRNIRFIQAGFAAIARIQNVVKFAILCKRWPVQINNSTRYVRNKCRITVFRERLHNHVSAFFFKRAGSGKLVCGKHFCCIISACMRRRK